MNANRFRRCFLAFVVYATACGVYQEHYETARNARSAGAGQRGLLPAFVPDSASNVHIVNDSRTGGVWIWCTLDPPARLQLEDEVRHVGWGEAAANTTPPPFAFNFPEWNPILGRPLLYTPPGGSLYFVAGQASEWHGIAEPSGRCWITRSSLRAKS